jgi:hypothetical protein
LLISNQPILGGTIMNLNNFSFPTKLQSTQIVQNEIDKNKSESTTMKLPSMCNQLSQLFNAKTLFLAHNFFYHSQLIKKYECTDNDDGTAKMNLTLRGNGYVLRKSNLEFSVSSFKQEKDIVNLLAKNDNKFSTPQEHKIQISNNTCAEFWKFLNRHSGHNHTMITSGGSQLNNMTSESSCQVTNNQTRIYFDSNHHKEICYKEEGKANPTCSSYLKIKEGKRGCTENNVSTKNNCFFANDLENKLLKFYGDKYHKEFVEQEKK